MDKCETCVNFGSELCDYCYNESEYKCKKSEKRIEAERLVRSIKAYCGQGLPTDEYERVVILDELLRKLDELVEELNNEYSKSRLEDHSSFTSISP